jgi:probable H4MPT-linked C1 transfer pathway protein
MCDARTAVENWQTVAASNWHALAWFAFHGLDERSGFVFDIGSTTTDIIPVESGIPVISGQNDLSRLMNHQLFYAGVGRTPICSLIDEVRFEAGTATVAREVFATALDVFLWLGEIGPSDSTNTADGRAATRIAAGRRLARMVCADLDQLRSHEIDAIATQTRNKLTRHLSRCVRSVVAQHPSLPLTFKTFGEGAWLAEEVVAQTFSSSLSAQTKVMAFSHDETTNQTAAALAVAKKRELVFEESAVQKNAN